MLEAWTLPAALMIHTGGELAALDDGYFIADRELFPLMNVHQQRETGFRGSNQFGIEN